MQKLLLILLCVVTVACINVTKIPMTAASLSQLRGQTVTFAKTKPSELALVTRGKAAIPFFLGMPLMYAEGNALHTKNDVTDPVSLLTTRLGTLLEQNYSVRVIPSSIQVTTEDPNIIAKEFNNVARYVAEVQTLDWAFSSVSIGRPKDSRYRISYIAKWRLIDTNSGNVIMQARCVRIPNSTTKAYTYDELLANGAMSLKAETSEAAVECAKTLLNEMQSQ